MKKAVVNIFRSLWVLLFVYYYIGNTAFIHTHVFNNEVITHSHPFIPGAHHTHANGEIATIAFFNAMLALGNSPLTVLWNLVLICFIFLSYIHPISRRKCLSLSLRAPPICLV
ncbi:MAG: hypothetical protein LKI39_02780 [Bacteroides sp.]|nr:hypothetical protein [Bacteroides sp.]MCI1681463.1 hypothetical protein [Bacteroides sp.]